MFDWVLNIPLRCLINLSPCSCIVCLQSEKSGISFLKNTVQCQVYLLYEYFTLVEMSFLLSKYIWQGSKNQTLQEFLIIRVNYRQFILGDRKGNILYCVYEPFNFFTIKAMCFSHFVLHISPPVFSTRYVFLVGIRSMVLSMQSSKHKKG